LPEKKEKNRQRCKKEGENRHIKWGILVVYPREGGCFPELCEQEKKKEKTAEEAIGFQKPSRCGEIGRKGLLIRIEREN